VANTYGTMQARIADELDRADLATQIQNAIQDAIGFYERRYFYFTPSPQTFTFSTVRAQEYYTSVDAAAIATSPNIVTLTGTFYGLRRQLHKREWEYIDSISTLVTSYAMPQDWAYVGEEIRLYPIPDNAYVLNAMAVPRLVRPSSNTDAGPWMNDAEALIRTKAKLYLLRNVIRASDMEAETVLLEDQLTREFAALSAETGTREAVGMLEPSRF